MHMRKPRPQGQVDLWQLIRHAVQVSIHPPMSRTLELNQFVKISPNMLLIKSCVAKLWWNITKTWIENRISFHLELTLKLHSNALILLSEYLGPQIVLTHLVQSLVTQLLLGSVVWSNLNHTMLILHSKLVVVRTMWLAFHTINLMSLQNRVISVKVENCFTRFHVRTWKGYCTMMSSLTRIKCSWKEFWLMSFPHRSKLCSTQCGN